MTKTLFLFFISLFSVNQLKANDLTSNSDIYISESFPILDAIESTGGVLSKNTKKWMKKWKKMNLEDSSKFQFKEISGTTSINLKVQYIDSSELKGYKAHGSFLPNNESGNPNSEIAYFNLAAIAGVDQMFRPAIRYQLGKTASAEFKKLINSTNIKGKQRLENKKNIIKNIDSGLSLLGCMKAKKSDSSIGYEDIVKSGWRNSNGMLKSSHPIVKFIQASKARPIKGDLVVLKTNYNGDAFELAREFSILLTFDSVFGQYDRFSGGNIVIENDDMGKAHFVGTDNGGAEIVNSIKHAKLNLKQFSRYDRNVINKIREVYNFLRNPTTPFLGYTDPNKFVIDMGMYFLKSPKDYTNALISNMGLLLNEVKKNEERYGANAYFQD